MPEADPTLELLRALRDVGTTTPELNHLQGTVDRALARETRRPARSWKVRRDALALAVSAAVAIAVAVAVIVFHRQSASPLGGGSRSSATVSPHPFRPSVADDRALQRQLGSFQAHTFCIGATRYVSHAQQLLRELGWVGWRVMIETAGPRVALGTGGCTQMPVLDRGIPSLSSLLNTPKHEVLLVQGQPPSVDRAIGSILPSLITTTGRYCFTAPALTSRTRTALRAHPATAGLTPAFAVTREPLGIQYDTGRQQRYRQGCAVAITIGMPAGSLRQIDIWLTQRSAPALAHGLGEPAPASYRQP